jgi:hypothetical protein
MRLLLLCVLLLTFSLHPATAQDAPTATPVPVFPIAPGSLEGNISDAQPVVRYRFDARAGDVVSISMDATSGSLDPFLVLLGPSDELIEQDDDGGNGRNAAISTTVTRAGRYIIEATRYTQGSTLTTGTFRLVLSIAGQGGGPQPTDPLATMPDFGLQPTPALIRYRESSAAVLDDLQQERYYAFSGERGDVVRSIMSTTSGDLTPRVEILNSSLLSITSSEVQSRPNESIAYATLPETGWYLARSTRRSGAGSFDLYTERVVGGAVLNRDEPVTGQFTADAPTVSYIFTARAGDLIAVNLFATEDYSRIAPEIRLLDLNLQTLAQGSGSRFATLRAAIPRSGTYIVQASNQQASASGGFSLRLTGTPVDISKLQLSPISYNEQLRGFISPDAPVSYYRFSGKSGERVTIEMATTSGNLDPFLILTDANLNEELTFNDNVSASRNARIVRYRIEKDGDYIIMAARAGLANGSTEGGFDLSLSVGDITLEDGALSASLAWTTAADLNLFVRDPSGRIASWSTPRLPSGGILQIDSNTLCNTPTDQPIEHIYWPQGALPPGEYEIWAWYQQSCAGSGPASFDLSVQVSGEDVLQMSAPEPLAPGQRYETRLRVDEDGSAFLVDVGRVTTPTAQQEASEGGDPLIVYGDSVQGVLNDTVYTMFYQFQGRAGDTVLLTAETLSGDLDPLLVLRDAADVNLPNGMNDDASSETRNSTLRYTLPADGVYIVAVSRFGIREGTTSGSFRLTLGRDTPQDY